MHKNLAVIPARGGSKRIPHKNIRDFLGKPIIAYSIETAVEANLFDEIIVSTDDDLIAEVAIKYGSQVPFRRSKENSSDHATLADVMEEVLKWYKGKFEYACCILPTAPLLESVNLRKGYRVLLEEKADSVYPIVKFSYPPQRAVRLVQNQILMVNPEFYRSRSQDLEVLYHDAGQFYWMKADIGLSGTVKMGFEIPETHVQDIDNEEDWKLAELKYRFLHHNH